MRYFAFLGFLMIVGCGFTRDAVRGFTDEALRQGVDIGTEYAVKRLDDNYSELKGAIKEVGSQIPKPEGPIEENTGTFIGALIAYLLGSGAKGLIRAQGSKKTGNA